ncbi:LAMI_0E08636g1_1 [Lachancea mirantina]|uniref:LAMI_0E08636g1_1 n=1 Tax=Lachancea mirantina TaxID=1230905 RepID=A0A1G4JN20_9SACH|nr:LAMI_0E08636g1_1 [Lachancea mirantina]
MELVSTNAGSTLYVGNIDQRVTKELLYELFMQVSPVAGIRYPRDRVLQNYQGFAFVEFHNSEDAQYVAKCMNNVVRLYDRLLKVRLSGKNSSSNGDVPFDMGAKLFIKNLDELIDADYLNKLFTKFGPLLERPEVFYLKNGKLKCAFVKYTTFEHSDKALSKLNNQMVMNKVIQLDYALKDGKKTKSMVTKQRDCWTERPNDIYHLHVDHKQVKKYLIKHQKHLSPGCSYWQIFLASRYSS